MKGERCYIIEENEKEEALNATQLQGNHYPFTNYKKN
jgi:hypothetical protein